MVEIINNYAITRLPIVPPYVRGIINLRGLIIPILDIRSRLGKAPAEDDCIVVLSQNETQLGILVDTVGPDGGCGPGEHTHPCPPRTPRN